ncbi:hypothetical protein NMY22_g3 [Coprinellus aureogranulatus]|nr:hypothetical protein NMY22_g3 [Coprinellus aureogranulatus]
MGCPVSDQAGSLPKGEAHFLGGAATTGPLPKVWFPDRPVFILNAGYYVDQSHKEAPIFIKNPRRGSLNSFAPQRKRVFVLLSSSAPSTTPPFAHNDESLKKGMTRTLQSSLGRFQLDIQTRTLALESGARSIDVSIPPATTVLSRLGLRILAGRHRCVGRVYAAFAPGKYLMHVFLSYPCIRSAIVRLIFATFGTDPGEQGGNITNSRRNHSRDPRQSDDPTDGGGTSAYDDFFGRRNIHQFSNAEPMSLVSYSNDDQLLFDPRYCD